MRKALTRADGRRKTVPQLKALAKGAGPAISLALASPDDSDGKIHVPQPVRKTLAGRERRLPEEAQRALAADPSENVRLELAKRPKWLAGDVVKALMDDENPEVAEVARNRPDTP